MCDKCKEVIPKVTALRAIGDVLQMAADAHSTGRGFFPDKTLEELGGAISDLASEALAVLGYEKGEVSP